jgi:hypothetical protein
MRLPIAVLAGCLLAAPIEAQDPQPKFRLGLFGFGVQAGLDLTGDDQLIFGSTLDLGDLYGDRLRMRASGELGTGAATNTYVISAELTYRFVADTMFTVPYVGGGLGLFSQDGCGDIDACPAVWLQFAIGFEINIRAPMRWLVEYHAEDAFSRHRLLIGLTTRRGR